MALGTADPADPVNVHDLHRRSRHLPNAHSSAAAARRAIRKSVATRYRVAPTKTIAATVWYANTAQCECDEPARAHEQPDQSQRIEDGRVQRLRQATDRAVARVGRGGRRPRIPFHPHRLARKPRLLARMLSDEDPRLVLVVGLVRALVHVDLLAVQPVEVTRLLGIRIGMPGWILDVVDPLPLGEQVVGLGVVRLPERPPVRRESEAADLDLVPNDPRSDDDRGGGDHRQRRDPVSAAARANEQVHGHDDRDEDQPHVAENRQPGEDPGGDRPASGTPVGCDQRAEDECRRDELVEDLAVQVHVVPHEIRIERCEDGGDRARAPRHDLGADRVHEQRGDRCHDDLRAADRPPGPAEDPVDRDEEEAVQRLRVRGRLARDEAEGPVVDERLREVVALVRERGEDPAAFVHEHDQAGDDRRGGDQPEVRPPHAAGTRTGASTCSRTHSSSISRHQSRWP